MDISARLEKLERENRRMKKIGIVAAVVVSMFIVGGQARPTRTVDAQSFILRDVNGTERATLAVVNDSPMLEFLDSNRSVKVRLSNGGLGFYESTGTMVLNAQALFLSAKQGRLLSLDNSEEGMGLNISVLKGGSARLYSRQDGGTLLQLSDSKGFHTTIGTAYLVTPSTGETHQTSAASIRMSNEKGDVIWAAPSQ